MLHHFFRGMFDGDGCAHKYPRFTFLSQELVLNKLREELIHHGCVSETRKVQEIGKICRIDYNGFGQCTKIKDYLYKDATVFMERKFSRISAWTRETRTLLG